METPTPTIQANAATHRMLYYVLATIPVFNLLICVRCVHMFSAFCSDIVTGSGTAYTCIPLSLRFSDDLIVLTIKLCQLIYIRMYFLNFCRDNITG